MVGLGYANDLTLVAGTRDDLQSFINRCLMFCHVDRLGSNVGKSAWFSIRGGVNPFLSTTQQRLRSMGLL